MSIIEFKLWNLIGRVVNELEKDIVDRARLEHSASVAALRQEIVMLWSMIETRDRRIRELEAKLKERVA